MDRRLRCLPLLCLLGNAGLTHGAHSATLPDPTRPADFVARGIEIPADVVDWVVNGITISAHARSAIVNGVVVVPGQTVGNAVVVEIRHDAVVLEYSGQQIDIFLRSQTVKRPVSN